MLNKEQILQDLRNFLADNPGKHLNVVQKSQLLVFGLYYCIKCREIMEVGRFEKDATKATGLVSTCLDCGSSTGVDLSKYRAPVELLDDPEKLAEWANGILSQDQKERPNRDRAPRAFQDLVRKEYPQIKYFTCKFYHPTRTKKGE